MAKYHTLGAKQVFSELGSSYSGLSDKEARKRLGKYGKNKIKIEGKVSPLMIFLRQFKGVLILLLIVAALISFALDRIIDGGMITAILILNAILGFLQEYKAEKSLEAMEKLTVPKSIVFRNGKKKEILSDDIVPGDLVVLEEGSVIPADLRLVKSFDLHADESLLTGESVPVEKITKNIKDCAVSERRNMCFMGTTVSGGRGIGIAIGTGQETEMGKIAKLIKPKREEPLLQKKMDAFAKKLAFLVIAMTAVLFVVGYSTGADLYDMLLTSISLAVSAVPEGLPAIITLTLALGVSRMAKKNALVRKLGSVETLGSATVICADKTGTMTTNEMTVIEVLVDNKTYEVTGTGFSPKGTFLLNKKKINPLRVPSLKRMIEISDFCNNAALRMGGIIGDPTEGALKVLAAKAGFSSNIHRIDEIPFSSARKMMTVVHEKLSYTKGAPEVVLKNCNRIMINGRIRKLNIKEKKKLLATAEELAGQGLRLLGFSFNPTKKEKNMVFVGIAAMIDPPKASVRYNVKKSKKAGIRTIMLTGDHTNTAKFIANQVGIEGEAVSGEELEKMSDNKFRKVIQEVSIFARLSPEHKLRILTELQKQGEIVAMTGDGVNDTPALIKSDIGVAMGKKGTEVAKQSADIILIDDHFSTIVSSVEEGRRIYDNIRKFIIFLLSANFDELLIVFLSIIMGLPLPLLPVQILWMNLLTDGLPALALSVEPKEKGIMNRKPRNPKKGILSGIKMFISAAIIFGFIASFSVFLLELSMGASVEKARTMVFTTAILFELIFVFNCRSQIRGVFRNNPFGNRKLLLAVLVSLLLQLLVIYYAPLQVMFGTVALGIEDWGIMLLASGLGLFVLPELFMKDENEKTSEKDKQAVKEALKEYKEGKTTSFVS